MKKILALTLALLMVFTLAACGGKKDPAPSGGGTADPGTSQQSSEQQTDGTAGEKWGDHDVTAYFPEPPLDKIGTVVTSSDNSVTYNTTWTAEEAKAYVETCKNAGFTNSEFTSESSGVVTWQAYNSDKSLKVNLSYSSNNTGVLGLSKTK